jgi:hypothetical protein
MPLILYTKEFVAMFTTIFHWHLWRSVWVFYRFSCRTLFRCILISYRLHLRYQCHLDCMKAYWNYVPISYDSYAFYIYFPSPCPPFHHTSDYSTQFPISLPSIPSHLRLPYTVSHLLALHSIAPPTTLHSFRSQAPYWTIIIFIMIWGSAVGIANANLLDHRGIGVPLRVESKTFIAPCGWDRIWGLSSLLFNGYLMLFLRE